MARDCVTHHHACDCREARFREIEAERDQARYGEQDLQNQLDMKQSELTDLHAFADDREARCARLESERDRFKKLAYAPGMMRCAKCDFVLTRINLYVNSDTIGPGNSKTEPCPNGCGPLWTLTERENARDLLQRAEEQAERAMSAESERDALKLECEQLREALTKRLADSEYSDAERAARKALAALSPRRAEGAGMPVRHAREARRRWLPCLQSRLLGTVHRAEGER